MSEKRTGTTTYTLDPAHPPRMTEEQKAKLLAMRDEDIDLSDTPSQEGKLGRRVGGPRFGFEAIVLDRDVLEYFHRQGDASSERINAVLREYVQSHQEGA